MSHPPINLTNKQLQKLASDQGDEIRRLNKLLQKIQNENRALARENAMLKSTHVKPATLQTLAGSTRKRPPRVPTYRGEDIPAFGMGVRIPTTYLEKLTKKYAFRKYKIIKVDEDVEWDRNYDQLNIFRPSKLRMKNGKWKDWSNRKFAGTHHVLAMIEGSAYYVGMYKCTRSETLNTNSFGELSSKVQEAVIYRADHKGKHQTDSEALVRSGQIATQSLELRRVGYDQKLQVALLKLKKSNKSQSGTDELMGGGEEGDSEEDE